MTKFHIRFLYKSTKLSFFAISIFIALSIFLSDVAIAQSFSLDLGQGKANSVIFARDGNGFSTIHTGDDHFIYKNCNCIIVSKNSDGRSADTSKSSHYGFGTFFNFFHNGSNI